MKIGDIYVEIESEECYGGCCRIKDFVIRPYDPEKVVVIFKKATCPICGRRWVSLIKNKWRHKLKLKSMGYAEDESILEFTGRSQKEIE